MDPIFDHFFINELHVRNLIVMEVFRIHMEGKKRKMMKYTQFLGSSCLVPGGL